MSQTQVGGRSEQVQECPPRRPEPRCFSSRPKRRSDSRSRGVVLNHAHLGGFLRQRRGRERPPTPLFKCKLPPPRGLSARAICVTSARSPRDRGRPTRRAAIHCRRARGAAAMYPNTRAPRGGLRSKSGHQFQGRARPRASARCSPGGSGDASGCGGAEPSL